MAVTRSILVKLITLNPETLTFANLVRQWTARSEDSISASPTNTMHQTLALASLVGKVIIIILVSLSLSLSLSLSISLAAFLQMGINMIATEGAWLVRDRCKTLCITLRIKTHAVNTYYLRVDVVIYTVAVF